MPPELNSVLRVLPKLSPADLLKVQATVSHLLNGNAPAGLAGPLYEALGTVLGCRVPYASFQHSKAFKTYEKYAPVVTGFVASTWPEANQTATLALLRYLLGLLVSDLKWRGVEPTLGSVVNNLGRVSEVFDSVFPSYRQCGLAYLVLEAMERQR